MKGAWENYSKPDIVCLHWNVLHLHNILCLLQVFPHPIWSLFLYVGLEGDSCFNIYQFISGLTSFKDWTIVRLLGDSRAWAMVHVDCLQIFEKLSYEWRLNLIFLLFISWKDIKSTSHSGSVKAKNRLTIRSIPRWRWLPLLFPWSSGRTTWPTRAGYFVEKEHSKAAGWWGSLLILQFYDSFWVSTAVLYLIKFWFLSLFRTWPLKNLAKVWDGPLLRS